MKRLLPFGLLLPAVFLFALYLASLFGYPLPYGTPSRTLLSALAWLLLFLIIHGGLRGWRSVPIFLVTFITLKFSAILYWQITSDAPLGRAMLKLAGTAILAWVFITLFWPNRKKPAKPKPTLTAS